jgi:hypothetical protein
MSESAGPDQSAGTVVTWRDLAPLLADVAVLKRQAPDLQQQITELAQHLAQQDQAAANAQQQLRSQLGAVQSQLATLMQAEDGRRKAEEQAERAARARHADTVARLRRWLAGVALFVATSTWPLLAGFPVRLRLILLASGVALALAGAAVDYYRSRPHAPR